MKRDWIILRDTREKRPLLFPDHLVVLHDNCLPHPHASLTVRLTVKDVTLETGDYALEGFEKVCLVERKGSMMEVAANCLTRDRPRFVASLRRLTSTCFKPYLILEGTPLELLRPNDQYDPAVASSALLRLLAEYHVGHLLLPSSTIDHRRALGEWVARLLIEEALRWSRSPNQSSPAPTGSTSESPSSSRPDSSSDSCGSSPPSSVN